MCPTDPDRSRMRLRADFNGLFGEILCLSHGDTCVDETGSLVELRSAMTVTPFDEDTDDEGNRDDLIASGVVEPAPDWLACRGSKWILRIDASGVRHESDLRQRSP